MEENRRTIQATGLLASVFAMFDDLVGHSKVLKVNVELVRQMAGIATAFADAGRDRELDAEAARYFLKDFEIQRPSDDFRATYGCGHKGCEKIEVKSRSNFGEEV